MRTGQVVGATDARSEAAIERALAPEDLWATAYRHRCIDHTQSFLDHSGRPFPILPGASPSWSCYPIDPGTGSIGSWQEEAPADRRPAMRRSAICPSELVDLESRKAGGDPAELRFSCLPAFQIHTPARVFIRANAALPRLPRPPLPIAPRRGPDVIGGGGHGW